jgi:hypothetical protein
MKEAYQEFKSANVTTKLRKLQSIEDKLIEDKLGSECLLFTEWMHNTHDLLGTQPPKNAQYEALKANEVQRKLDEVINYIMQGFLIKDAIRLAGYYDGAFYRMLNDGQAMQLQSAKRKYNDNKH